MSYVFTYLQSFSKHLQVDGLASCYSFCSQHGLLPPYRETREILGQEERRVPLVPAALQVLPVPVVPMDRQEVL